MADQYTPLPIITAISSTASGEFGVSTAGGINQVPSTPSGYVDCQSKENHSKDKKRNMDFKEKQHVSLDKSKIECYNCHRKGHFTIIDLGEIKGEDLMVTMAGAMHQQLNPHHKYWWLKMVYE
ncbi:hypothetical protein Tco_0293064, partial [Tanacetum coccineum]